MRPMLRLVAGSSYPGFGEAGGSTVKPGNGTKRKSTILVVEDEVMIRYPTAEYLRDAGYRVLEASNADDAKAIFHAKEPIEVVFSDVNMPGSVNGFELARWIREQYPDVNVLLTSGASHLVDTPGYGQELGPLLQKPYSPETLLGHIKRMLMP